MFSTVEIDRNAQKTVVYIFKSLRRILFSRNLVGNSNKIFHFHDRFPKQVFESLKPNLEQTLNQKKNNNEQIECIRLFICIYDTKWNEERWWSFHAN